MPYKDKEKREANKRRYRNEHRLMGLCIECTQPHAENSKSYCLFHLGRNRRMTRKSHSKPEFIERRSIYRKERYNQLKLENKCVDCGMPLNEESRMGNTCLSCYRRYVH